MGKSRCHCINLRRANNAVTKYYDRMLGPCGVTVNQYSLLINLKRMERANIAELAHHVDLDRTTLVRTIRPLLDRGLMEDLSAPGSRDRVLTVSAAGEGVLKSAVPLWERAQRDIETALGRDVVRVLGSIVEKVQAL